MECEILELIFLEQCQKFCEFIMLGTFKMWWFSERTHNLLNKQQLFWPRKGNSFRLIWYPTIATIKYHLRYLKQMKIFLPTSSLIAPPQTPGLDPLLHYSINISPFHCYVVKGSVFRYHPTIFYCILHPSHPAYCILRPQLTHEDAA